MVAVGVVPNLLGAVHSLVHPPPPVPYWLDSLQLVFLSGCTILVTLYLMSRSGESWEHFGVAPVCPIDAPFAFIVLIASILIWRLIPDFGLPEKPLAHDYFPRPRARVDYAMMALKYGFAACAEEIVTRAYLITRLTTLLRSRGEAVLVAAILFASYHVYQGLQGFIDVFVFGVMYGMIFLGIGRVWPLVLAHALYNIRLELMLS
ncbi:CPBP family intramembrane metalloprotease [Gemmata sp. G18]|uniref:CPBP family intramembrane metalloprotease n=2 Tax=Gemmata palustris TaxID=2822762 RepID=A0ABS5BLW5_9BACT|nr:CPBP family intramembrane glutamic endopeptidase [Gemmata palustris]MBP3954692.1 CPBP family intramembrane metalloprotease [Gemmata palustris]